MSGFQKSSGMPQSTVHCFVSSKRRKVEINTIKRLCDGLGITLAEFFDDDIFKKSPKKTK